MQSNNYFFTSSSLGKNNLNQVYSVPSQSNTEPVIINFNESKMGAAYSTPAFDPTGKRMYLTRRVNDGNTTILAIYVSTRNNNGWGVPVKLNENVNAEGFNSVQPFVTADGKQLFFSSNKPGGQGGYDILVSDLDADGNAVNSINLGSIINTPLDEQAPYYDEANQRLIYSSKGFVGLGGFDFFESYNDAGQWSVPVNMGYPMNSSKDDLYYSPDDSIPGKFYISSDRESDCCLNLFEGFVEEIKIKGKVTDCYSQLPVTGVKVSLIDTILNQTVREITPSADGAYLFKINSKRPYKVVFTKAGYFTKTMLVQDSDYAKLNNDTLFTATTCLQHFEINKPVVIKNILYDFDKATLRPESEMVLNELVAILNNNPKIKIELSSHTDSIGSDAYNLVLSQARAQACVDYIIAKGIDKSRITARGYGKTRPIAPNSMSDGKDNPDGRQLNRRTEFMVTEAE
jgi:OOP family OmpA-OmpF porin